MQKEEEVGKYKKGETLRFAAGLIIGIGIKKTRADTEQVCRTSGVSLSEMPLFQSVDEFLVIVDVQPFS